MPNFEERVYSLLKNITKQDSMPQGFEYNPRGVANNGMGSGLVGGNNQDFYGNIDDPRPNFGVQYGNGLFYKQMKGNGLIDYNLNRNNFRSNPRGMGIAGGQGMDSRNLGDLRNRLTNYYIRQYDELGGALPGGIVEGDEKYMHPYPASLRMKKGGVAMAGAKNLDKCLQLYDNLMECHNVLGARLSELGEMQRHDVLQSQKFEMYLGRLKETEDFFQDLQGRFANGMIPKTELMRCEKQLKELIRTCLALQKQVLKGHGRKRKGGSTSVIENDAGGRRLEKSLDPHYMGYGYAPQSFDPNPNSNYMYTKFSENFNENQAYMDKYLRDAIDYNRAYIPIRPKAQTYLQHDVRQRAKDKMVANEIYYQQPITEEVRMKLKEREALRDRAFDLAHQDVKYKVPYPYNLMNPLAKKVNVETGMGRSGGKKGKGASGGKRPLSAWVKHVMAYAQKNGMSYGEALKHAGASFKKKGKGASGGAYLP